MTSVVRGGIVAFEETREDDMVEATREPELLSGGAEVKKAPELLTGTAEVTRAPELLPGMAEVTKPELSRLRSEGEYLKVERENAQLRAELADLAKPKPAWWRKGSVVTTMTAIIAAVVPLTTGVQAHYQKERELALQEAQKERELALQESKQAHEIRASYLDRLDKPGAKLRTLRFVLATTTDPALKKWAEEEAKRVQAELDELDRKLAALEAQRPATTPTAHSNGEPQGSNAPADAASHAKPVSHAKVGKAAKAGMRRDTNRVDTSTGEPSHGAGPATSNEVLRQQEIERVRREEETRRHQEEQEMRRQEEIKRRHQEEQEIRRQEEIKRLEQRRREHAQQKPGNDAVPATDAKIDDSKAAAKDAAKKDAKKDAPKAADREDR